MSVRCMSLIFMRREESAGKESRTPEVSQGHRDEWFEGGRDEGDPRVIPDDPRVMPESADTWRVMQPDGQ